MIKIAVIVALIFCSSAILAQGKGQRILVVDPPITNHMILQDGALPPVCKAQNKVTIHACRGEYEPASFVVETIVPDTVRVTVGSLTGPGVKWPKDAVDVRVVKDYYFRFPTRVPIGNESNATVAPMLLVHDEGFLAVEPAPTEKYPDAMTNVLRGALRDTTTLQPVYVNKRKQFWITVHVPEDAVSGNYQAVLRIVPDNALPKELTLEIEVYPFDLLPPMKVYSIWYPPRLQDFDKTYDDSTFIPYLTREQYRIELRNMMAHGIASPISQQGIRRQDPSDPDLPLDFTRQEELLAMQKEVGMSPVSMYWNRSPVLYKSGKLTEAERARNHRTTREVKNWAVKQGYKNVFFYSWDEAHGDRLLAQYDSMLSIQEAGEGVVGTFGSVSFTYMSPPENFFEMVGPVLTQPNVYLNFLRMIHVPASYGNLAARWTINQELQRRAELAMVGISELATLEKDPKYQKLIADVHGLGRKIFHYLTHHRLMPQLKRLDSGLTLWRIGIDGTADWAYVHNGGDKVNQALQHAMVYRTENGVLDTLEWEGFREGVDDIRYLTTLLETMDRVKSRFPDEPLVRGTEKWLARLDLFSANPDLDAIRREMASRIKKLTQANPVK